jgi:DNA-binding SARP family transcriptional activator
LSVLGRLAAATGDEAAATSALGESLALFRDNEDRWGMAHALLGLARVAAVAGHPSRSAALLGAADSLREELGIELSPPDRQYRDATIAAALTGIGEPAFWCAWAEGRTEPLHSSVAAALTPAAPVQEPAARATAEPETLDLRIRALGVLDVRTRDGRIEKSQWGSNRARELLLFLACHPDGCTKAQVGLALWPDASPAQLRNTFHVTLHRLRNALEIPDAIMVDGDRYRINPSLQWEIDSAVFERDVRAAVRDLRAGVDATERLVAATALYRGDFLEGESVGEWADEIRERLRSVHVGALEALGRALMERERYGEAADAFATLLAADPVNEDACRRQMICLVNLGDRAGALRAFDALVRALRDDLGVKPGRDTVALRDKLATAAT